MIWISLKMLKQTFDKASIIRVITPEDVQRWNIWGSVDEKDNSIATLAESIQAKNFTISPLKCELKRGKNTYQATNAEDAISIKLLDRYIRRIYKVRQSDRHRIVSQVKTLLNDSGDYAVLRLDIKECYESMSFLDSVKKLTNDMILAPSCVRLLRSILDYCISVGISGLPRGLAISPTLAELYLEPIDRFIKQFEGVVYSTRYVDDLFILVDKNQMQQLLDDLVLELKKIGLALNDGEEKKFIGFVKEAEFDYLGYSFKVSPQKNRSNRVEVLISQQKIDKIKQKIAKSFSEYRKTSDIKLLQQRLNYLTVLKVIKKNKNGVLLGGLAYNYRYVSNQFDCLKKLDGFLIKMLNDPYYSLTPSNIAKLSKTSFFGAVSNKKQGTFTRRKASQISKVWENA